jgi:hypothetical protein
VNHSTLTSSAIALASILGGALLTTPAGAQEAKPSPAPEATPSGQAPLPTEAPPTTPTETPATIPPPEGEQAPVVNPATPPAAPKAELVVLAEQPADLGQNRDDDAAPEVYDGNLRHHQDHWLAFIGFRVAKISSSGFDPFADSDELAQFSAGVGRTVMTSGSFSLAGVFLYDIGGRSSEARGATTDLIVHRLTLGAEARYHFFRQFFAFGRVAPGAIHSIAKIEDVTTDVDEQATRDWVFATDLSAGATLDLSGFSKYSRKRKMAAWITLEGGYGFAGETELSMTADGGGGPVRAEPLDLGPLALAGPFMRGAFVLTY